MTDLLRDLARAKATFQARTVKAILTEAPPPNPAEKLCVGCGTPTKGMCWTDCGMSLCGAPLCDNCRHVDEKYGGRHEPRASEARHD